MLAGVLMVIIFAALVAVWGGLVHLHRERGAHRPRLWLETPRGRS